MPAMWYDVVVLAVLVFAVLRGASKGIVWQLAVIAALLLCFVFSGSLSVAIAPAIPVRPPLNRWIAMFALYIGFSFLSFGAARVLRSWIEKAKFVEYDRHLGAIFGFVKGAVFCLFMTFFGVTLSAGIREQVMHSYSGYAAAIVMDRLHPVMPKELHNVLEPYIHQLDRPGMDLRYTHEPGEPHGHDDHDHDHGDDGLAAPVRREGDGSLPPSRPRIGELIGGASWFGLELATSDEDLLPPSLDAELRELALEALRRASPEDREALLERLQSGVPDVVRAAAEEWLDDRDGAPWTADDERPTTDVRVPQTGGRREQQTLLREIAEIYADTPAEQARFVEEHELLLTGLPERVELAVLRDWHADILSIDRASDPEPQTSVASTLEERIIRQLTRARVSVSTLPEDLQSRLRAARR